MSAFYFVYFNIQSTMIKLLVDNVNIKIQGDLTNSVVEALSKAMTYKTNEFNGFTFIEIEHKLFNRLKQLFPTGLYSIASKILDDLGVEFDIIDKRLELPQKEPLKLHAVTPYDFQQKVIAEAVENQRFIIEVATGGGKTVIAAAILAELNMPSIFVVHTGDLFEQAYDELSRMLKIPIGRIGGGMCDIRQISVVMIQTIHSLLNKEYVPFDEVEKEEMQEDEIVKKSFLIKNEEAINYIKSIGCVLIDESHHLRSSSYVTVMKTCKLALYRGGLSATPFSGDGRDLVLQAYAGRIIGSISASYLIRRGYLVKPTIFHLRGSKQEKYLYKKSTYQAIYKKYIINNAFRNTRIVDCVKRFRELDKTVLITVTRKNHGKILLKMIQSLKIKVEFIHGAVEKMERKKFIKQVQLRELPVIIGTSLADEGLNIPTLDCLVLAGAGKSQTRMKQRIGRVLRRSPGKKEAFVVDFKDNVRYLLGHYKKRREICETEPEFKIVESFE
jgi:superfamily II DNA or RNA helicase